MSPTVLSVAYPFAQAGPAAVGGAEQICTSLDHELVRIGYKSLVVAQEGSIVSGELFATAVPNREINPERRESVVRAHQASLDRALASYRVDLIHMHGIDFHRYRTPEHIPILVTLHLPPSWYPDAVWRLPARYHLQCVSETQRLACPPGVRDLLSVVPNGVETPHASDPSTSREDLALMLSRICPEKNLHVGLDAARRAGLSAILAGATFPYASHLDYLHHEIEPRLGPRAHLLHPVGGKEKHQLLARARCLLLPTLAPETSSLVAMEALAAGTPVIAFPSGAIPEIIEHGRTGFPGRNVDEMASAIRRVHEIDPEHCRATATARYSRSMMFENYLRLYNVLLNRNRRPVIAQPSPAQSTPPMRTR